MRHACGPPKWSTRWRTQACPWKLAPDKEQESERESQDDDDAAYGNAAQAAGEDGTAISPGQRSNHHDDSVWPVDHLVPDEVGNGHRVDRASEQDFQADHLVYLGETDDAESCQHQDSDAGAEVAA